jgi:hydroxypyruvate isomerase
MRFDRRYAVNCSLVLAGRGLEEQLAQVTAAGFDAVEFWWPFSAPDPDQAAVSRFIDALQQSGLRLVGLNVFAGDMAAGERGVLSIPGRERELAASVEVAAEVGAALGCTVFNALYGRRVPDLTVAEQYEHALRTLADTARTLEQVGTVVLEPLSGVPDYPLKTAAEVVEVIRSAHERGIGNVGLLLDVFHIASNGGDVAADIAAFRHDIAHVQLADAPGRGAPGSGTLDLDTWLADLIRGGYAGAVALEFTSQSPDPLISLSLPAVETWGEQ